MNKRISTVEKIISEMLLLLDSTAPHFSIRENRFWAYKRQDNSIFGLVCGLFILQENAKKFSPSEINLFEQFEKKVRSLYPSFKNKDNKACYNFFPTRPSKHFANGLLMNRFDHFRLPDDIDDSALIYLSSPDLFSQNRTEFLALLKKHQHSSSVFNTWFGKNMPEETDVCAISNVLVLYKKYAIELDELATKSLEFVLDSLENVNQNPFSVSRHYAQPILILYHYVRLITYYKDHPMISKEFVLKVLEMVKLCTRKYPALSAEKMLGDICLKKLGESTSYVDYPLEFSHFYTFIGAPFAPILGEKSIFSKSRFFWINWYSPIQNLALRLEYELN
ncbi:MAG: hypothetical protein ACRCVT_00755 [Leadbetterella sp.]